jgi:DNA-binding MarR family transcriptional regulator
MRNQPHSSESAELKEVAATCLCQKARSAARALTRFYDRHFAGTGIEPTQFNILVSIGLSEPVPLAPLANHLGLERTTLTRNLALLQRGGLVATGRGEDARQRLLSLTPAGRRTLKRALPRWKEAQRDAVSVLGSENFVRLSEAFSLSNKFIKPKGKTYEE